MQGWRTEMEDDHISLDMPSQPNHTYLAVFDGYVSATDSFVPYISYLICTDFMHILHHIVTEEPEQPSLRLHI